MCVNMEVHRINNGSLFPQYVIKNPERLTHKFWWAGSDPNWTTIDHCTKFSSKRRAINQAKLLEGGDTTKVWR